MDAQTHPCTDFCHSLKATQCCYLCWCSSVSSCVILDWSCGTDWACSWISRTLCSPLLRASLASSARLLVEIVQYHQTICSSIKTSSSHLTKLWAIKQTPTWFERSLSSVQPPPPVACAPLGTPIAAPPPDAHWISWLPPAARHVKSESASAPSEGGPWCPVSSLPSSPHLLQRCCTVL